MCYNEEMRSFRENKDHLEERAQEASGRLRERLSDEVEQVREGLHRRPLAGGGQWDHLEPGQKPNRHQQIAAATHGFASLANLATVSGAALTTKGMFEAYHGRYVRATVYMGIGRCLDLADGKIAQKTQTLSDKGAALDAGFDKALAAGFLGMAVATGDMPVAEAAAHGLQQARIFRESVVIKNNGGEPNPSIEGKRGMAALWLRAGGIVLTHALEESHHPTAATVIDKLSHTAGVTALYYNQQAIEGYTSERIAAQAAHEQLPIED